MKTREEVSEDKIRGGFYSPRELIQVCIDRVDWLTQGRENLRLLEPGAGNGAFLKELAAGKLASRLRDVTAIEVLGRECEKCRTVLEAAPFPGTAQNGSVIRWACETSERFDIAVGNPPFVRYQFISHEDKRLMPLLSERLGVSLAGVSNLWIPILLAALGRLCAGGVFAFIIPTECFTGISAGVVREWLSVHVEEVHVDLFPPGSFPSVLQEVVVLSGVRRPRPQLSCTRLWVRQHQPPGDPRIWSHLIPSSAANWTRYLLAPAHLSAIEEAAALDVVTSLGQVAKFEVAAVTGANEYFSIDLPTADRYRLHPWTRPLLPRARHAEGLRYTQVDHELTLTSGARALLLDFASHLPSPETQPGARRYLEIGRAQKIPARYKTRIRDPWYRVPHIRPGALMLSKRCHRYPRAILNEAQVVTTDTIYRGSVLPLSHVPEGDLVAAFHNSLTILSAELEGRSFGGGVLELVPSEISRLLVAIPAGFGCHLDRLDAIARTSTDPRDGEALVDDTDKLLIQADVGLSVSLMASLRDARCVLLQRRLDRN